MGQRGTGCTVRRLQRQVRSEIDSTRGERSSVTVHGNSRVCEKSPIFPRTCNWVGKVDTVVSAGSRQAVE